MFQRRLPSSEQLSTLSGSELAGTRYTRPLSNDNSDDDSDSATGPLLPGLHVTGTGLVHTAPQHGQDYFRVGLAHGLVKVRVIINTDHRINEL